MNEGTNRQMDRSQASGDSVKTQAWPALPMSESVVSIPADPQPLACWFLPPPQCWSPLPGLPHCHHPQAGSRHLIPGFGSLPPPAEASLPPVQSGKEASLGPRVCVARLWPLRLSWPREAIAPFGAAWALSLWESSLEEGAGTNCRRGRTQL